MLLPTSPFSDLPFPAFPPWPPYHIFFSKPSLFYIKTLFFGKNKNLLFIQKISFEKNLLNMWFWNLRISNFLSHDIKTAITFNLFSKIGILEFIPFYFSWQLLSLPFYQLVPSLFHFLFSFLKKFLKYLDYC